MILEIIDWKEYHPNGQLWIEGKIGIVADLWKHLYDTRDQWKGYEGKYVCRLGNWKKYYDNSQLAWQMFFNDNGYFEDKKTPSYRKDGTAIDY
ncbi:hypothetical protein [Chryseobacterium bernardetii]|uniref:hypothetical protein n=1 Tax=Chryseobacterium bernardetii TaxID=1241978 RepID=UPI00162A80E0|nr:hypothetical protein [Chryseobacterium bernardetii]